MLTIFKDSTSKYENWKLKFNKLSFVMLSIWEVSVKSQGQIKI